MKYLLIFLTINLFSCGDRATNTIAQPPATPNASPAPAASEAPAAPNTPNTPAAPIVSPQTTATQTSSGPRSPLMGTYWKLIELNGKKIEGKTAKEMYLMMDPSSPQFKSHSGCNLVMGEAKFSGMNQMWFINLLPTTSDCKTPEIDAEFQKALGEVASYSINGNILQLSKKGSVPVLKFMAKG